MTEERVVSSETTEETVQTPAERTVVEQPDRRTVVAGDDPVGNAFAASQLIQTIVWSVVVLVLLAVGVYLLYRYGIL